VRARHAIGEKLSTLAADSDFIIVHNAFTLHFCLPLTAAMWELAARKPAGNVIAWCHDLAWTNPLYQPAMHDGYPWDLLRVPAPNVRYVMVSDERKHELLRIWGNFRGPVSVIPNGIDTRSFLRLSDSTWEIVERFRLLERDLVLLLPVRITRRKNIELAIEVVATLKERGLDVCFIVSGPVAPHHPGKSDVYLTQLMARRAELGLQDQVVFLSNELGHNLDDSTVSELYCVADALLFPSAQEGFGLPILEAGLSRVPAIVSDIPIFDEVGGEDVWKFGLDEPAETIAAQVMEAVSGNSANLFRRVRREYSWRGIADRELLPLLTT
jgi:glycosyltransferase involved in cell wall biosynthesis